MPRDCAGTTIQAGDLVRPRPGNGSVPWRGRVVDVKPFNKALHGCVLVRYETGTMNPQWMTAADLEVGD